MTRPRRRLDFEQLLSLQDVLDMQLVDQTMSLDEYEREWTSLLDSAGYTPEEYERLIDQRWDDIEQLRKNPIRRSVGN